MLKLESQKVLRTKVYPSDWIELAYYLPKDFARICSLGRDFQMLCNHFERIEVITGSNINELFLCADRIKQEYLRIVRNFIQGDEKEKEELIKQIKSDIVRTWSFMYTDGKDGGHMKPISLEKKFEIGIQILTPLKSFIISKVYDCLQDAYINRRDEIGSKFYEFTTGKAGSMPVKEVKGDLKLPPLDADAKPPAK